MPFYALLLVLLSLAACKSGGALFRDDPIVDTQGISVARYEQDLLACEAFADQVDVAEDIAVGAASGAVVGAVLGAAVGNSSTAQRGASAGAVLGGVRQAGRGWNEQERVLRRCLIGRGYRVLN